MSDHKKEKQQINIELPEDIAEGKYANLATIAHSNTEFVIDFISLLPGIPKAKVKSRIILTPQHTKRLLNALAENVKKYESQFGKITENNQNNIPFHLGAPIGEA